MDANGQRAWLLAERWQWVETPDVQWDGERRSLRLASRRNRPPRRLPPTDHAWATLKAEAVRLLDLVPETRDRFGTWARYEDAFGRVVAGGAGKEPYSLFKLWRPGVKATDLAMGHDGVLHVAADGEVLLHDRRGRMKDERIAVLGFHAWRLAADPAGGCWVLDRRTKRLAHTVGQLFPDLPYGAFNGDVFRPDPENPAPPRLRIIPDAAWPEAETAGIACSPGGRLAVLSWRDADGLGLLRVLRGDGTMSEPVALDDAHYPFSLAWVSDDRVAVLVPGEKEALVYPVPTAEALARHDAEPTEAAQVGDVYPLRDFAEGPFLHGVTLPPHYPTRAASRPLHRLSLPGYAPRGATMNEAILDAGTSGATWHRLFIEAAIPPRCGIVLHLAATETRSVPSDPSLWFPHRFGEPGVVGDGDGVPRGAWTPERSEIPYHPGLLQAEPKPGRAGLFTALVQRAGRRVRSLRGRYLWVRAELVGDGLASPELAAVRAYGPRFSYRDQYLPELYRENVFGRDADEPSARSTAADFLERFLGNFEGVLTRTEDRIAAAHLLTDPRTVPAESLDWLGTWIGMSFDAAVPEDRRRRMLRAAPDLAARRGTVRGLALALELATGGAVSGGEIVILEDFKLRRTFATILGADLSDEDDPLLAGITESGNSYVGDTLFLGDEQKKEFLALYNADLPLSPREERAISDFFERLAHRVTVLVHQHVEPQDLGLIRRVVAREVPAHVEWRVVAASRPLMVGVSSLVGVDTYLGTKPGKTPVRVDVSRVGIRDYVLGAQALDPRLEGGSVSGAPVARFAEDEIHGDVSRPQTLDGSPSTAAEGRTLDGFQWSRTQ